MTSLAAAPRAGASVGPEPRRAPTLRFGAALVIGALGLGALAGDLASSGHFGQVLALGAVLLPIAIWKRPYIAPGVLLAAAILIEQSPQIPSIPLTQRIPLFQAIGSIHLQGADILLLVVFVICLMKRHELGVRWWPRSHVSAALVALLACVGFALINGKTHGGDLRTGLMQSRPYIYLAVSYLLTAAMVTTRRALQATLWAFVWATAFKAVQGIYVWALHRHMSPRPEAFIGHEASYFFVIYIVLVFALWLFHQSGRLRTIATRMLPLVIWAMVVNDRRVAWAMLGGAILCLGVIAYQALPGRRRILGKGIVALTLISVVYFPVMWNSTSSLAQPVRAIKSQVHPSVRDASSDLYRIQENANLQLNIKQAGLLGKGLGVKIDYALPIANISGIDPLIAYVPHNDILDVMLQMGLLGALAVWFLIGSAIIAGSRLARSVNRELAVIGAVVAPAIVAYAVMGAEDQGFFMFRLAFITGVLLGLLEAATRMARAKTAARAGS